MKVVNRILGESTAEYDAAQAAYYDVRFAVDSSSRIEVEKKIAKSAPWAYSFALFVLKDRFPMGEPAIAKDPEYACVYARDVLRARWPEAEPVIARDPMAAYMYATQLLKTRWIEAEASIVQSPYKDEYLGLFPDAKEDWVMNGWIDWLDT